MNVAAFTKEILGSPVKTEVNRVVGKALKIRKNIIDLMRVRLEHLWAIKKVQLALNEEAFELLCV